MREAGDESGPINEAVGGRPARDRRFAAERMPGFAPLPRKLRPPHPPPAAVRREALIDRLRWAPEPLVILEAPAGYGKSTLLTQWATAIEAPSAWLQLDTSENDPLVLLRYLTAALEPVAPIDPKLSALLHLRAPPVEEHILPGLAAAVAAASPFLLVLDDAHLLHSGTCWRYLALLLDEVPDGAHVAIGARHELPLPLARLRAAGRLAVLHADDLRMGAAEARSLLDAIGCAVDEDAVNGLVEATEGWPIGLSLAALAGRGGHACDVGPPMDGLRRLHGDQRDIAAYLTSEVLHRQPDHLQYFMMQTAILDQLSGPLCRAVTGRDDAHVLLTGLMRKNLFVVALDDRDEWYRYHHLFGELLRAELEREHPTDVSELHRRAAAWYQANGDDDRAVRHGLAAGDGPAFVDLAARACDAHYLSGRSETAHRLFDSLPDSLIEDCPALQLTAAQLAVSVADDRVIRWARAGLAAAVGDEPSPLGGASMHQWQLVYRAVLGLDGVTRMREDAAVAYQLEFADDPSWSLLAARVYARALYMTGASRKAEQVLRKALPVSTHDRGEESYVLALLILVAADQDRWDEIMELDARLSELAALQEGPILLARTRILAHRGDPALPAYVERAARDLEANLGALHYNALHNAVVFAEALLEHGDAEAAEAWTARAEAILRRYPDAGILRGRTVRLREALERRRMTDPLTPTEQRVLELLPSRLTAAQMAARLFVTTNTVKTHMRHLYTKLGVTTRADAVERSHELGLLGQPYE
jgi:LuxR family maltose regulon positive regulatory protein